MNIPLVTCISLIYTRALRHSGNELSRINERNNPDNSKFDNGIFCAYPGNDNFIDLFLEQFQITKDLYECDMNKRVAKVLSCDHAFKTSKNVGVTREDDGKFECQYQNVFLGLN